MGWGFSSICGKVCRRVIVMLILGAGGVCAALGVVPEGFTVAQILDHRSGFTESFPSGVVVDREGRIWVSSDLGGLFVGDGLRFLKVDLPPALEGRKICDIAADDSGRIWVLSAGGLGTWERIGGTPDLSTTRCIPETDGINI
jgi:ligand-binding sensor domain-containing protein